MKRGASRPLFRSKPAWMHLACLFEPVKAGLGWRSRLRPPGEARLGLDGLEQARALAGKPVCIAMNIDRHSTLKYFL